VRDPVKRLVLIKDRDRSVSTIRTLHADFNVGRLLANIFGVGAPRSCRCVAWELVARYLSLVTVLRTFASLDQIDSARARRSPLASPILEKLQISHFVGSHCHSFTPLR
jgi:hypothetical protein